MRNAPTLVIVVALALALLPVLFTSHGQQPAKVYRIGYLGVSTAAETDSHHCPIKGDSSWRAWVERLREHGYVPGQNLLIECRWTGNRAEPAPALAAELVRLKPDILVVESTVNVRAAKQATTELPILMQGVIDPVRRGLVASLAHPGGNVTGLADTPMAMEGKRLQLLKEALPTVSRVAVLTHPSTTPGPPEPDLFRQEEEAAAQALGLTLQYYGVRAPEEFESAFTAMTKARAEALFVRSNPLWITHEPEIVALAAQSRLPAVCPWREFVAVGGLLSYDVNDSAILRRLGDYVDKILKGAKPADLPVEQPTKFELVINLKTAKALGLTIPPTLLIQADEVIQ